MAKWDEIISHLSLDIGKTAFYEWVKDGRIVKSRVRGYYLINATQKVLGLPLTDFRQTKEPERPITRVNTISSERDKPSVTSRQLLFVLFAAAVDGFLDYYPMDICPAEFNDADWELVEAFYRYHKRLLCQYHDPKEKLLYAMREMKQVELNEG